jgi:hypothetical protein
MIPTLDALQLHRRQQHVIATVPIRLRVLLLQRRQQALRMVGMWHVNVCLAVDSSTGQRSPRPSDGIGGKAM